jgi:hypothetical protein
MNVHDLETAAPSGGNRMPARASLGNPLRGERRDGRSAVSRLFSVKRQTPYPSEEPT